MIASKLNFPLPTNFLRAILIYPTFVKQDRYRMIPPALAQETTFDESGLLDDESGDRIDALPDTAPEYGDSEIGITGELPDVNAAPVSIDDWSDPPDIARYLLQNDVSDSGTLNQTGMGVDSGGQAGYRLSAVTVYRDGGGGDPEVRFELVIACGLSHGTEGSCFGTASWPGR